MSSPKLAHLEAVRGLAAVIVVVCHVVLAFAPPDLTGTPAVAGWSADGPAATAAWFAFRPVGFGTLPVYVFFVLSGVVLSQSSLRPGSRPDLAAACVRRFVRLAGPAAAATLLGWAVYAGGWADPRGAGAVVGRLVGPGETAPWLAMLGPPDCSLRAAVVEAGWGLYFQHPPTDPHRLFNPALWTIRVELYGSLVVFAFLALFGRHPQREAIARWAALAAFATGWGHQGLFLAGIWLADRRQAAPAANLGWPAGAGLLAVAAGLAWAVNYRLRCPLPVPLVGRNVEAIDLCLPAAAVLLVAVPLFLRPLAAALSAGPLVRLGGVSFGLYLVHMPVLLAVGGPVFTGLIAAGWSHATAVVVTGGAVLAGSLAGGWLIGELADKPSVVAGRWVAERLLGRPQPDAAPGPG